MLGLALCRILASPSHKSVSLILPLDMNTRAVPLTWAPETPLRLLHLSLNLLHQETVGLEIEHGSQELGPF